MDLVTKLTKEKQQAEADLKAAKAAGSGATDAVAQLRAQLAEVSQRVPARASVLAGCGVC